MLCDVVLMAEDAYLASLGRMSNDAAKTQGVAVGRAAGAAMLALRKDDGATKDAPYTPGTGVGKWRPHPNPDPPNPPIADAERARGYAPSSVPGWGNVMPFTLLSASQFWLPGPPALTSETYAKDYQEVKSLGGQASTARTPEQTEIARFWFQGPSSMYQIARTVAAAALPSSSSMRARAMPPSSRTPPTSEPVMRGPGPRDGRADPVA